MGLARVRARSALGAAFAIGVAMVAWPCIAADAADAPIDVAKAIAGVLGYDQLSAQMVAYCDAQAPAQAGPARAAWQRWREANDIASVEATAGARSVQAARQLYAQQAASLRAKLAAQGPVATVCAQMPAAWQEASMNARQRFPLAYRFSSGTGAAATPSHAPPTVASATGTVYTPAQLAAPGWHAGPRERIYLRGRLVQRGEHVFLDQEDAAFSSRTAVHPDLDLRSRVGQRVVLEGRLDGQPWSSLVELEDARLVLDGSGLKPSPLPQTGQYRATVPLDRITAAPGHGIAASDVVAVLHESRYRAVTGLEEHVLYLLRDGSAYRRCELPPSDLDVARSKALEPQQWARWRQVGDGYEMQPQDDFGRPDGDWQRIEASTGSPWPAGSRISGSYSASSFHGSLMLGGVYSKAGVTLGSDGRFTDSHFSEGGSGSMAATNGFNAYATSHSDSRGTRSSGGGGNGSVAVSSRNARDDGADHRGSYRLDGYTAELHYDSGRIERGLSFRAGPDAIYWFHHAYARDKP